MPPASPPPSPKTATDALVGTHWGHFRVRAQSGRVEAVRPYEGDANPARFGASLMDAFDPRVRIAQPMVRKAWLEARRRGAGPDGWAAGRSDGQGPFVALSWDAALDLVAQELERVRGTHGNGAIFGGSYGWASAGRFHHAQSQIHRFLNTIGGYVASVNTYSGAAAEVMVPHALGIGLFAATEPTYADILAEGSLMVTFGGVCVHNNQVVPGGVASHPDRALLGGFGAAGAELINISPMREDVPEYMSQTWVPIRPASDTALMLALAYVLIDEDLYDHDFVERCTAGFGPLRAYVMGESDGQPKTPDWAAALTTVPAATIRDLARKMAAARRCVVALSLSMQRAEHGEQPYFMAIALAALLGQIGLRGGGVGLAWGSNGRGLFGGARVPFGWGKLAQGRNPVRDVIPVARIADALLSPGAPYDYNGARRVYPDLRLVYWAGGNPFHHHQDLARLERAWERPETVIVHNSVWTATARRADIVLPATTFLERDDIVCGTGPTITFSRRAAPAHAQARDDHAILAGVAARMGVEEAFTEGRSPDEWLAAIYDESRRNAAAAGIEMPDFATFRARELVDLSAQLAPGPYPLERFRADPEAHPLATPSGRVELSSERLAGFGYDDCPGHPVWLDKQEWLGAPAAARFPLHLLSPQPKTRLHSQFDFGRASIGAKGQGREGLLIAPEDAAARGIAEGDVLRVFNDRGETLTVARLTEGLMPGVVQLATGAWYDPDGQGRERHGNPNVLCADRPTSRLSQGPSAQSCLVEVARLEGPAPAVRAHEPPAIEGR